MAPDEFLKLFKFSRERIRVNFRLLHWHLRKIVVVFGITKCSVATKLLTIIYYIY